MALIESLTGIAGSAVEDLIVSSAKTPPLTIENNVLAATVLKKWRGSKIIEDMITANEYYSIRNTAIAEKKREYKDDKGNTYANDTLSNARIASGFLRTSVNQKVNYGFGKPFVVNVENISIKGEEAKNEQDTNKVIYITEWQNFFNTCFRQVIKCLAKNAINNGIGWVYVWIDEKTGKLKIIDVPSETIYPEWEDKSHRTLVYLTRDYVSQEIENNGFKEIKKVEFWDSEVVERYIDRSKDEKKPELIIDVASENMLQDGAATAHMAYQGQPIAWGKIPFIALKGTNDELPLLNVIKEAIDAYDSLVSKGIDSLQDDLDPVLVIEGITADVETLKITRKTMQEHRIITLDGNKKAYYVQVKADISASQQKLEHLQKIIREWSVTVDTQDVKFGSNPSGVALKAMYQDLDIYMDGLELEFEAFIENLKYFFDRWLQFKGVGTVELWEQYKIIVTLNRDMMVNLSEDIKNALELAKTNPDYTVSVETIDSFNPATESYEIEQQRREAELKKKQEDEVNSGDMRGFIEQSYKRGQQDAQKQENIEDE